MAMMRFFVNVVPPNLGSTLEAYKIDSETLKSVRICIDQEEADSCIFGGAWAIYKFRLAAYKEFVSDCSYFGCLAEEREKMYIFTARYIKKGAPYPERLKLPPLAELRELHLL